MKTNQQPKKERGERVRSGAVHAARRLLRRTRSLAQQASQRLPRGLTVTSTGETAEIAHHATLAPPSSAPSAPDPRDERIAQLQACLERSEHASSWLRARLRAERLRRAARPAFDATELAADLTHDLMRLRAHDEETVGRVVRRTLAAHGLPVQQRTERARSAKNKAATAIPGWTRETRDAAARQVLTRVPDVANPSYVYHALAVIAENGGGTLASLTRAAGYDSAIARRRLRLAVEALATLGALHVRDGFYTLNTDYRAPTAPRPYAGSDYRRSERRHK